MKGASIAPSALQGALTHPKLLLLLYQRVDERQLKWWRGKGQVVLPPFTSTAAPPEQVGELMGCNRSTENLMGKERSAELCNLPCSSLIGKHPKCPSDKTYRRSPFRKGGI